MPITKLALLSFKQDEATREAFSTVLVPALNGVVEGSKGVKTKHAGDILSSNGSDVSSSFKPVLGLGWDSVADFMAVVTSPAFENIRPLFLPLVTEVAGPQLYDTDVYPKSVYRSALTEVFRVNIGEDEEKKANIEEAWGNFVKSIGTVNSLSGVSVNVEEKTFLGMIGWGSEEARKNSYSSDEVEALKGKLGDLDSFLAILHEL